MADRVAELLRQRALIQEHLAWLEREIAAAQAAPPGSQRVEPAQAPAVVSARVDPPKPVAPTPLPQAAPPTEQAMPDPDALIEEYRVRPDEVHQDVRKGCLLYFFGAFLVFGLVVVGLYFALRQD